MKILRHIALILLALASALAAMAAVPRPVETEGLTLRSDLLGRDVRYSVIVPQGAEGERFPVLYLLHGIGGDCSSWLEYTDVASMIQRGEVGPMVVVMPDGYLSYYSDAADGSMPYERMFLEELMPEIERKYPVSIDPRDRLIGGFSMGGFGALTLGLRNRDCFGSIIALSPSMRTDSVYASEGPQEEWEKQWGRTFDGIGRKGTDRITPYYRARSPYHIIDTIALSELAGKNLIIDIGDRENSLAESAEQIHRRMAERGIAHTYRVRGGGHDFDCWNPALLQALRELYPGMGLSEVKPEMTSPIHMQNSALYLPKAAAGSDRRYPVVYVRGALNDSERETLARRAAVLTAEGAIRPMAICFLGENDSIGMIEQASPALRASRRMRALVEVGTDCSRAASDIATEPTYTAIVLSEPQAGAVDAGEFARRLKQHGRYPRLWLSQTPANPGYAFASDLHVLLREMDLSHRYRVADTTPGALLPQWEEWLKYIDSRFHI